MPTTGDMYQLGKPVSAQQSKAAVTSNRSQTYRGPLPLPSDYDDGSISRGHVSSRFMAAMQGRDLAAFSGLQLASVGGGMAEGGARQVRPSWVTMSR